MDNESERNMVGKFCKVGIIVLSVIVVFSLGIQYVPDAVSVTSSGAKRQLPIYSVDTSEKKVALSFDCAWGDEYTAKILECLAKYNVKVTFFMTGGWVDKYPEDVKAIYAAGHDLGNHSENHKHMSTLSKAECTEEIEKPHEKVKALTGYDMTLFRPPFGDYNNTLIQSAENEKYQCIQWNVDSLDWKDRGTKSIIKEVLNNKNLGNGSIILMHNGAKDTLSALPSIIEGLQQQGYEIVPISQLVYQDHFQIDTDGRQHTE